jgi:hypothetical protein
MTLPVKPAGVVNYNTPVAGGQSATPQAKKDGLPVGQIATSLGVGGLVGLVNHSIYKKSKENFNILKKIDLNNLKDLLDFVQTHRDTANYLRKAQLVKEAIEDTIPSQDDEVQQLQRALTAAKENLSKMDLDNTAKHLGKTFGWAALAAGATAAGYGLIRALVHRNKEPKSTPTSTPTA